MTDPPVPLVTPPGTALRPDALAEHAAHVSAVVTALDPETLGAAARRVAAAAPGSRSAVAAEALAGRWESAVRAWAAEVGVHGATLARSAHEYADTDRGAAAAMRAGS